MEIVLIVALLFVGVIVLFASNFGKDPSRKTDAMLWREYNLHDKRIAALSGLKAMDARERQKSVITELVSRGYDITKLIAEEAIAEGEGRPMKFENCTRSETEN